MTDDEWADVLRRMDEIAVYVAAWEHPWRVFDRDDYATLPWDGHAAAFASDRARWKALLATVDRQRGRKVNEKPFTIESLTDRLVSHEHHHLFTPR